MTLKEIKKIIDEADFYLVNRGTEDKKRILSIVDQGAKSWVKNAIEYDIKIGCSFIFFKFNDNYEVEKRWVVAHIDKEKKIIKKKLDEMSDKEIQQVRDKFCNHDDDIGCNGCHFDYGSTCLARFNYWKQLVESNKDREFEVEVEE